MPEKFENPYSLEKAQDEANLMREKIGKGDATDYAEAEKLVEDEKNKDREKYKERKKLIKKTDKELIESVMSHEGHAFQDQTEWILVQEIAKNQIFLKQFMKGKDLYDIGCGSSGVMNAEKLFGKMEADLRADFMKLASFPEDEKEKSINVEIQKLILVDPYVEKK